MYLKAMAMPLAKLQLAARWHVYGRPRNGTAGSHTTLLFAVFLQSGYWAITFEGGYKGELGTNDGAIIRTNKHK